MRVGVDIVATRRFKKLLNKEKFTNRIFTQEEMEHIMLHKTQRGQIERMAGKFSAKEAVAKMLGTGISEGVTYKDIEVKINADKKPNIMLHNKALTIYNQLKLTQIDVSISHDDGMAIAFCIAT